jgi:hypothetical protein
MLFATLDFIILPLMDVAITSREWLFLQCLACAVLDGVGHADKLHLRAKRVCLTTCMALLSFLG